MDDVVDLVGDFVKSPERDSPVIVLTGSRFCGKTTALESLVPALRGQTPFAPVIDCASVSAETPDLLSTLMFELNNQCADRGRLSFPRLITGMLVLPLTLHPSDPTRAREQVRRVLEEHRKIDKLRDFLSNLAVGAAKVLPPMQNAPGADVADVAARSLAGLLLDGVLAGRFSRKVMLGAGQDWYGDQGRELGRDPLDALVDLSRRASRPEAGSNRRLVAELLWAAFLSDLHANYASNSEWDLNSVVLLDNADTPNGRRFLDELSRVRNARRAAHPHGKPDPLTIVATSRGAHPARVLAAGAAAVPLRKTGYASYERMCDDGLVESGWYPVRLPDLNEAQTSNLVAALGLRAATEERVSPILYQFTSGHPGSTHVILAALSRAPDPADLATVLGSAEPWPADGDELTVEERLLGSLTGGVSAGAMTDLMACAAARDLDDASRLATHSMLMTGPRGARQDVFVDELWVTDASGTVVMLPVLRRLLLRQLAASPASWQSAYAWLADAAAKADDLEAELYYTLATGMVERVARRLSARLGTAEAQEWLNELHAVTSAPGAPASPDVTELVDWAEPQDLPTAAVAELVAVLWLLANSISAHGRRELYRGAAACFGGIAPYAGRGRQVLRAEEEKYRRRAEDS